MAPRALIVCTSATALSNGKATGSWAGVKCNKRIEAATLIRVFVRPLFPRFLLTAARNRRAGPTDCRGGGLAVPSLQGERRGDDDRVYKGGQRPYGRVTTARVTS